MPTTKLSIEYMEGKSTEFEKMLDRLEKEPVPERTCNIDDENCESCSG